MFVASLPAAVCLQGDCDSVFLISSDQVIINSNKVFPFLYIFQAEQTHLAQFYMFHAISPWPVWWHPQGSLQHIHVLLVLGRPELDIALQMCLTRARRMISSLYLLGTLSCSPRWCWPALLQGRVAGSCSICRSAEPQVLFAELLPSQPPPGCLVASVKAASHKLSFLSGPVPYIPVSQGTTSCAHRDVILAVLFVCLCENMLLLFSIHPETKDSAKHKPLM